MSAFSDTLTRVTKEFGSQAAFAREAGVNRSNLNGWCSGVNTPDVRTVERLVAAAPEIPDKIELIKSYLLLHRPAGGEDVQVLAPGEGVKMSRVEKLVAQLPSDAKEALADYLEFLLKKPETRLRMLFSSADLVKDAFSK